MDLSTFSTSIATKELPLNNPKRNLTSLCFHGRGVIIQVIRGSFPDAFFSIRKSALVGKKCRMCRSL